jgi:hypothetical protein
MNRLIAALATVLTLAAPALAGGYGNVVTANVAQQLQAPACTGYSCPAAALKVIQRTAVPVTYQVAQVMQQSQSYDAGAVVSQAPVVIQQAPAMTGCYGGGAVISQAPVVIQQAVPVYRQQVVVQRAAVAYPVQAAVVQRSVGYGAVGASAVVVQRAPAVRTRQVQKTITRPARPGLFGRRR